MNKIHLIIAASFLLLTGIEAQDTVTIYPDVDAIIQYCSKPGLEYVEDTNYGTTTIMRSWQWTMSGYPHKCKSLIDFDLSSLPQNAYITNATLFLYGTGNHVTNLTTGSSTYKSNASYLRRIITSWDESTVTWNTTPSVTSTNQDTIPNSTTVDQDYEMDVTNLINDMITYPGNSFGLMQQLVTESAYTEMRFASSDYTIDTTMRPKLVIEYELVQDYQIGEGNIYSPFSYEYSNPFSTEDKDSKKQYLYLAPELQAKGMVAGDIFSLALDIVDPQTDLESMSIKMGHTSNTALSSSYLSGLTTVFSGSHVPYSGWNTFVLSSPFTWDGTSNIVVEVCYHNTYYGSVLSG